MLNNKLILLLLSICFCLVLITGCHKAEQKPSSGLQVVTTLFPTYDFARTIGADKAQVTMLLPPGVEPHTFEPRPEDMLTIGRARLFIYTSPAMEPWAEKLLKGIDSKTLRIVEAGQRANYRAAASPDDDHHPAGGEKSHDHKGLDPHVWLDFDNASLMVDAILEGFVKADAGNADLYRRNAESLKKRLSALDERYRKRLANCGTRTLLHGGHYTFGYLARRYDLDYHALSGVSSDSEPSAARMVALVKEIRTSGATHLFAEELLSPRLTETLAREAGVGVLMLHGAHNLAREELAGGVSFFDLMEHNLERLQKGLACSPK